MFETQQNTSATATSVEQHAEQQRKTSGSNNNNLRGGVHASGPGSNPTLSSNERPISATDVNRDEFHIRERYLSRPSPHNTVGSFPDEFTII